jgi:CO/xanthine dehydrogenase Mo-binding subunit
MTNATGSKLLGDPIDRIDGPLKVTGAAPYPSDVTCPGLVHAALVQSTIAAGTISRISTEAAEAVPDVLTVITHQNAPTLAARHHGVRKAAGESGPGVVADLRCGQGGHRCGQHGRDQTPVLRTRENRGGQAGRYQPAGKSRRVEA